MKGQLMKEALLATLRKLLPEVGEVILGEMVDSLVTRAQGTVADLSTAEFDSIDSVEAKYRDHLPVAVEQIILREYALAARRQYLPESVDFVLKHDLRSDPMNVGILINATLSWFGKQAANLIIKQIKEVKPPLLPVVTKVASALVDSHNDFHQDQDDIPDDVDVARAKAMVAKTQMDNLCIMTGIPRQFIGEFVEAIKGLSPELIDLVKSYENFSTDPHFAS
jgi:phage tail protein X